MSHRLGTCSSCNAQYKVPASFQADRAKCKACGGVVEIGPVGGAAAPKPAAKPAPKAAAPAKPVPARPVPAAAAKPAPKPVAEEKDSVRAAAQAAAQRVRDAGRKSEPEAESKAGDKPAAKAGARSGAKARGGASGSKRSAGRGAKKEKSKTPLLVAVALVVVAGGGAAWFLTQGGDEGPQAAESVAAAPEATPDDAPEAAAEAAAQESAADSTAAAEPEAKEPEAAPAETKPAEAAPADLEDLDLSVFPDEPKLPGTSDGDWVEIQAWTASFFDPNAGAAGNRARGKLFERGREAFPAVINAMKRLDFSTDDGFRAGDLAQRFLMDVCNGQNFSWKYGQEPADVLFNKKVVRSWIKAWEQGRESPKAWAKLTKSDEADAVELFKKTGPFEGLEGDPSESGEAASASSALDDL